MSRSRIFAGIRTALDAAGDAQQRRAAAARRVASPLAHPLPQGARLAGGEARARFADCLRTLGVDLMEVGAMTEVPSAIAAYLRAADLPLRLRRGEDPVLAALPWSGVPALAVDVGPAQDGDAVGLSRAFAGIAETGTLALASGPDNPVTLAFLPDTHIVLLERGDVVGSYDEACARLRAAFAGRLPRTLNLVTGASRTGDIGGKIVKGAHGPRRLAVVLVPTAGA